MPPLGAPVICAGAPFWLHQLAAEESGEGMEYCEVKLAHSEEAVGRAVMDCAAVQEVKASCTLDQSPDMLPQGPPRGPWGEAAARAAREDAAMTDFMVADDVKVFEVGIR